MRSILVDAGPLIALFDKNDNHHQRVLTFLKSYNGSLITTWPVLTEVMHMLDFHPDVPIHFMDWVREGGVQLFELESWHLNRIFMIFKKYRDLPSDLADATLIVASENLKIRQILTIDSDFEVFRTEKGEFLENVLHHF